MPSTNVTKMNLVQLTLTEAEYAVLCEVLDSCRCDRRWEDVETIRTVIMENPTRFEPKDQHCENCVAPLPADWKDAYQEFSKGLAEAMDPPMTRLDRVKEALGIDIEGNRVKCGDCEEWVSADDAIPDHVKETVRCPKCVGVRTMQCQECKSDRPIRSLSWLKGSDGLIGLICPTCAGE